MSTASAKKSRPWRRKLQRRPKKNIHLNYIKNERSCKYGNVPKIVTGNGARRLLERFDYEVPKIINNILDPNTKATAKRKITMTMTFAPTDDRVGISAELEVKVGLAPTLPVQTFLYVCSNPETGGMQVVEMVPEVPGQQVLDGGEQEPAAVLKLVK